MERVKAVGGTEQKCQVSFQKGLMAEEAEYRNRFVSIL
jgi:hypothetical protein